jgi:hypothetical protein
MDRKLVISILPLIVAACAGTQSPVATVSIPDKLKPAANEKLAIIASARGVQIYECKAKQGEAGVYAWTFVAPEAQLFDNAGNKIGRHYAGPRWEASDGSNVEGTVKERANAAQPNAVPWLLVSTKSVGGQGAFSKITSIQRVNTAGGVAPTTGCSKATLGSIARIPYTADYYMLSQK